MLSMLILVGSNFWDRFFNDPNLNSEEVAASKRDAEEILKRHEDWVQYALIANSTEKIPCMWCPGEIKMVTIAVGEVYKYGVVTQRGLKSMKKIYQSLDVSFHIEIEGSYMECKEKEVKKILSYQFLPESWKPEVKLIRPPGNTYRS